MLLAVIAVVLSGCSLVTGLEGCTAVAIPSFSVMVRDSATLTVRKTGYRDWNGSVTLKQNGCHVRSVSLTALGA